MIKKVMIIDKIMQKVSFFRWKSSEDYIWMWNSWLELWTNYPYFFSSSLDFVSTTSMKHRKVGFWWLKCHPNGFKIFSQSIILLYHNDNDQLTFLLSKHFQRGPIPSLGNMSRHKRSLRQISGSQIEQSLRECLEFPSFWLF